MKDQKLIISILVFLLMCSLAYAADYPCYNCSNCTNALKTTVSGDIVRLMQNITASGSCVNISNKVGGAAGITFDCQGYSINGTGTGNGVNISGGSDLIVKNCMIYKFNNGVSVQSSPSLKLSGNTLNSNVKGIYAYSIAGSTIVNNTANYNTASSGGMEIWSASNSVISGNTANYNSNCGLKLYSASGLKVVNNTFSYNNLDGLVMSSLATGQVAQNTLNGNHEHGVYLMTGGNSVTCNIASNNWQHGIYCGQVSGTNTVSNNMAYSNSKGGIFTSSSNVLSNNRLYSNMYGINFATGSSDTVNGNCVCGNSCDMAIFTFSSPGSGDNNYCNRTGSCACGLCPSWKDSSVPSGCKYLCTGSCSTRNVLFSYRIKSGNPLVNCSLWTNISGSWAIDLTRNDTINDAVNNFTRTGVPLGNYKWAVTCIDDSNSTITPTNPVNGFQTFMVSLCA